MIDAAGGAMRNGFTLLEILVALVVLGLLMAGLAEGMRFGVVAWHTQARLLARHDDLDAADRLLRHLVADMDPGTLREAPVVRGGATALIFTTDLPQHAGRADVALLVDDRHRLLLRWTPHRHEQVFSPAPAPEQEVLLDGVARLDLAYWPQAAPFVWASGWDAPSLPGLVRIRLVFTDDKRQWPDIVAAPMRAPRAALAWVLAA
jgi:general secretion pathway protein J